MTSQPMVDQGLWDRPNHEPGADYTQLDCHMQPSMQLRDLPNYMVTADVIGFM